MYKVRILALKNWFAIALFFGLSLTKTNGQDQYIADSLVQLLNQGGLSKGEQLVILKSIAENHMEAQQIIAYSDQLIQEANRQDSISYVISGYLQKGNAYRLIGDLTEALSNLSKAADLATNNEMPRILALINISRADVYSGIEDFQNALSYYNKSIATLRELNDSIGVASALLNAGDEYFNLSQFDTALEYFIESKEIFDALSYDSGSAYCLGNIGLVYAQLGKHTLAKSTINKAVNKLEKLQDYYPICIYYFYLSNIYLEKNNVTESLEYALSSLRLAKKYGLKQEISDAHLKLSEVYTAANQTDLAFSHYKDYILYRDSVNNLSTVKEMAEIRRKSELAQKQIEVDLLNQQKENQRLLILAALIGSILIGLLAFGLYRRNTWFKAVNKLIQKEKDRSDELLLNILPEETAQELKEFGKVKAKRFESATIMFADFEQFTTKAESVSPEILVKSIDFYFSKFDEITDKYGLEKIKTNGDSFICAGGIPFETKDHARKMILAGLEILEFVEQAKSSGDENNIRFDIRVGVNTGPLVAGVVGKKKFAYDIWGDTVNVASRLETTSEPGHMNISESTYQLVKDEFTCEYRGNIPVKNRGSINMYFVKA